MWWSAEDYAELNWRFDKDGRRIWAPCGIIPVAALWPLCRYRHKGHWTKHTSRLARDMGRVKWGDEGYAREELVALSIRDECVSFTVVSGNTVAVFLPFK